MEIRQQFLPEGHRNRPGFPMKAKGLMIHSTNNWRDGAGDEMHGQYMANTDLTVSWHVTVDKDSATQHIPYHENAWHAGDGSEGYYNRNFIGMEIAVEAVEMGEPLDQATYDHAVETAAHIMRANGLNRPDQLVPHSVVYGKDCPHHTLFDVEQFKRDVFARLQGSDGHGILSEPTATVQQAQAWAQARGASQTFVDLAPLYWRIAPERGGVNPAIAYAQSAKETGFGKFGGVIDESYNNPTGMKTASGGGNDDPNAHQRFASWEEGVTAHVDHLALYAGAPGYPRGDTPDPRHFPQLVGTAKTVEQLSGRWATDTNYGASLVHDYLQPLENTEASDEAAAPESEPAPTEVSENPASVVNPTEVTDDAQSVASPVNEQDTAGRASRWRTMWRRISSFFARLFGRS